MSYLTQSAIGQNKAMQNRVAQAAVSENLPNEADPDGWTMQHFREWGAAPGWDAAWASALASHEDTPTYDPGMDEAVITDGMILSQVQAMIATEGG